MKISRSSSNNFRKRASTRTNRRIVAADEDDTTRFSRGDDFGNDDFTDNVDRSGPHDDLDNDDFGNTLDDMADAVQNMKDNVDDIQQDPVNLDIDNNISDHYIAECEKCHGIFISAVIESNQNVQKVTGECPLCNEETDQYLKWIVRSVSNADPEPEPEGTNSLYE